ncbi:MAG: DUF1761 domain-containing protein [Patescibacteria group bacterium]|nr:DUF1761 domain-containing protein [Patescibacteria group bacterium]
MAHISIWPVIVAAIAGFAASSIWYSPALFGKEWMSLAGIGAPGSAKGIWKRYASHFVVMIVTFAVLAFFMDAAGTLSSGDGAFMAFLAWLGFVAPTGAGALLWQKKPLKLALIESVGTLVSLMIGGAIIGAWA